MRTDDIDLSAPDPSGPPSGGNSFDGVSLLHLTKQQRNLLLLRPVFALELNKNSHGAGAGTLESLMDGIDTHYLVLAALDFMMEETTMNMGCTQDEVLAYLTSIALEMKQTLTVPLARKIAETVLDSLDNKAKGYKEFEFDYFDAPSRRFSSVRFRLVTYEPDLEDVYRYRPTSEGYLVYLGMLDMAPEDAQILMEKMLDVLLKRGAFDVALEVAKRARKLSLEYRQLIQDRLNQAIRAPGSVKWASDIGNKLDGARSHVAERQAEDYRMEESVREAIVHAEDPKTRTDLSALLNTLKGAGLIRSYLVNDITIAPQRFLDAQKSLFRARRPAGLPDLDSGLFPIYLGMDSSWLSSQSEDCVSSFYPPSCQKLYELNSVFALLLERRVEDVVPGDDEGEIVPHAPYPDKFSKELIEEVESWIALEFDVAGTYQLDQLIAKAASNGFDTRKLQFLVMRLFRCYAPSESPFPHVVVGENGRFVVSVASGTNLQFTSRISTDE